MRIAFISTIYGYPWGGADVLWTSAAEYALQRGDDVLIAIAAETAPHPRIQALKTNGAQIHIRRPHVIGKGRLSGLRELKQRISGHVALDEILKKWRPQRIVVSQGGPLDYIYEENILQFAANAGIPFELICQSNSDSFSVSSERFEMAQRWAKTARRFWFVSEHNRRLAEIQLATKLPNAKVIQNPMELRDAGSLPWPASPPWSFAVVARLDTICKGLDLLFAALQNALANEKDWRLSVFGRGSDEKYLKELARFTDISDRVRFAGYTTDIASIWREHHMLLLPSRLEGCALAMLEAMACGRPVLATPVGGAAEWIRDDMDGFLCAESTSNAIADTLARAWGKREQWRQMGESAAQRFQALRDPTPHKTLMEDFA